MNLVIFENHLVLFTKENIFFKNKNDQKTHRDFWRDEIIVVSIEKGISKAG